MVLGWWWWRLAVGETRAAGEDGDGAEAAPVLGPFRRGPDEGAGGGGAADHMMGAAVVVGRTVLDRRAALRWTQGPSRARLYASTATGRTGLAPGGAAAGIRDRGSAGGADAMRPGLPCWRGRWGRGAEGSKTWRTSRDSVRGGGGGDSWRRAGNAGGTLRVQYKTRFQFSSWPRMRPARPGDGGRGAQASGRPDLERPRRGSRRKRSVLGTRVCPGAGGVEPPRPRLQHEKERADV